MTLNKESKILIIDDFEMVRVALTNCLKELGYQFVEEAADGKQALEMLELAKNSGRAFDLVFSDLNMPRLTGLDLLVACRVDPRFKNLPFVMISAEAERQYVVLALQQGASDYIIKPFSAQILQEKIEKIAERMSKSAATSAA